MLDGSKSSNFYPRSPCGERQPHHGPGQHPDTISIHALLAESDGLSVRPLHLPLYFYPRSPCGERPHKRYVPVSAVKISIHALLAESDYNSVDEYIASEKISIHALLAESDQTLKGRAKGKNNFYPRSPCGERPIAELLQR